MKKHVVELNKAVRDELVPLSYDFEQKLTVL